VCEEWDQSDAFKRMRGASSRGVEAPRPQDRPLDDGGDGIVDGFVREIRVITFDLDDLEGDNQFCKILRRRSVKRSLGQCIRGGTRRFCL
jgi:hypothetical protein